jgi:hypothetical protein
MKLSKKIIAAFVVLCSAFAFVNVAPVSAGCAKIQIGSTTEEVCSNESGAEGSGIGSIGSKGASSLVPIIATTIATVVGILSVILIIWAGIMYSTAAGDAGKVTRAKQIIIGAVIGLVITIIAASLAAFVKNKFVP